MYKDSKGLLSAGIGFLINDSPQDALAIRGWVHKLDGRPATAQDITQEWTAARSRTGASDAHAMEAVTQLRLPRPAIDNRVLEIAQGNIAWLKAHGHAWDAYPADGQLGLLSLAWNGLGKYPNCLGYIQAGNWFYAAGEATFSGIPRRQSQTQDLLRSAGRVMARGLDPEVLYFDQARCGRAFFFKGGRYASCEIHRDGEILEGDRPQPVAIDSGADPRTDWPSFARLGFGAGIHAAVNYGNGKLYFFQGSRYLRYDTSSYVTDGPFAVDSGQGLDSDWNGLAAVGFGSDIDAAVNWGDGRVFFFKGDSFVTYSVASNCVVGVRRPIDSQVDPANDWRGMAQNGFGAGVRGAINWGNGAVFFFKGSQYAKFLIHPGAVEYVDSIDHGWGNTLKIAGLGSGIDAAVEMG
jgi:hypothetical protein